MGDVPISDSGSRRPRPSVVGRWESAISRSQALSPPPLLPRARTSTSTVPASAPLKSSPDSSSVVGNVTMESFSAFDCSICYLPLKSPIFQCTVGHVVCSTCHDKLNLRQKATQCHVCRAPTPGGYSRCNAMEQAVESIRLPCPHAAHGCAERPAFAGPAPTALLEHFADEHGWLRRTVGGTGTHTGVFEVRLREGYNVVVVTAASATAEDDDQLLLVMNVEQAAPVCNTITAFCIHAGKTGTVRFDLSYHRRCPDSGLCSSCRQELKVVCTDLSSGLPGPSSWDTFVVPRW